MGRSSSVNTIALTVTIILLLFFFGFTVLLSTSDAPRIRDARSSTPLGVGEEQPANTQRVAGIERVYDENDELKNKSTKFIKISLSNLTVTVIRCRNGPDNLIYSNFDPINRVILIRNTAKT